MKRTLCLFLALILAVGICFSAPVTITASAAEAVTSGNCGATGNEENVTWSLVDGTLTISGTGAMADYKGDDMPWKNNKSAIKKVVIENGVTTIGEFAFYYCGSLKSVTIPESVTSIGASAFENCSSLGSVEIPEGVITIGEKAFYSCFKLDYVTIPESVTSIGTAAFVIASIAKVKVPCKWQEKPLYKFSSEYDQITVTIADHAYKDGVCETCGYECPGHTYELAICTNCSYVCHHETVTNGVCEVCGGTYCGKTESDTVVYFYNESTKTLTISGEGEMADFTNKTMPWYSYRREITTIVINKGVTSIGKDSFLFCTALTSVTIPESVTTISDCAFCSCSELASISIPDSVTEIGAEAFNGCTSLTTIEIPDSVTTIGNAAFYDCTSLTTVGIPDGVTTIGSSFFSGCTKLTSATIPSSVTTIGSRAFKGCTSLTTIEIPDSVTTIGYGAFDGCTSLTAIEIPGSVTTIESYAFDGCTSLTTVTIPSSVTTIESYTFDGCTSLTTVTIPSSVTTIETYAFNGCTSLITIGIPASVTTIESYAFNGCTSLTTIRIPGSVTTIGANAFKNCTALTTVSAPCSWNENPLYTFGDGVAVNSERHTLENNTCTVCEGGKCGETLSDNVVWFYDEGNLYINGTGAMEDYFSTATPWKNYKSEITTVVINNGVTTIGDHAFDACTNLATVTIPSSVTTINRYAFRNCTSLTTIEIPNSVTTIGSHAFYGCTSLTAIEIPDSVTTIEGATFYNCTALKTVEIPDSVTTIDGVAFYNCTALTTVTIPSSVTSIGELAFVDCTSLATVNVPCSWNENPLYTFGDGVKVVIPKHIIENNNCTVCKGSKCGKTESDTVTWVYDEGTLYINGTGAMANYNNNNIFAPWYKNYRNNIKTIVIEKGVTTIGKYAFSKCTSLTTVTIPESVTTIADRAFFDCTKLTTVNVPCNWDGSIYNFARSILKFADHDTTKTATCISKAKCLVCGEYGDFAPHTYINGKCTVEGCGYACAHETITDGVCVACRGRHCGKTENDKVVWFYDVNTTILIISGEGEMADFTDTSMPWYNCIGKITRVVINKGVTSIGESAFAKCTLLEAVKIGEDVTTIGDYAFAYCSFLRSVTMGDSVTTIGANAFKNCTALTTVNAPCSWNEKPLYTFDEGVKVNIERHTLENNTCTVCEGGKCGATESDTVVWFYDEGNLYINGTGAMADYDGSNMPWYSYQDEITNVVIGSGVTTICDDDFSGCISLTTITVDDANKNYSSVDGVLFNKDKTELIYYPLGKDATSYTIPESVTTIDAGAFKDCTALTSVTIGEGITTIDDYAFSGCENMTLTVVLGSYAHQFAKTNNIPYIFNDYSKAESEQIKKLTFTLNADSESYSVTGCDTPISGELKIPATYNGKPVTSIGIHAFSSCTSLETVTIGNSVTSIGDYAFSACTALATVTIPDSVTTIGNYTFNACRALATVTIPDSVTTIGNYTFNDCTTLATVTIGKGVTTIGDYAFNGCNKLLTVNVPCDWDTENPPYAFDENVLKKYHNIVIDEAVAATCTKTGLTEGQHCTRCDDKTVAQEVVPALNHKGTLVQVEAKAKTCTTVGWEAYEYCTACDYTTKVEIPASHELQEVKAKAPTCTEIGYDAYEYCTACTYTTYKEKAALNHNIVIDKAVEATCTATGLTEGTHCSRCNGATKAQETIAKKGHTETKGGTEGAHTICSVCKDVLSAEHEFASKITTEPTYTKEGIKTFTCECGYSYEEVIPCLVPGEIKAEEAESNSFSATVVDINSIVTKLQLTEEEKALIEQGADMKIVFKLSDIGATINTPEKEAIFKALTNEKIAVFLDIQLVKQIANSSVNVQKLNDLIKVTVELPAELVNKAGNIKRSYSVLRYHDGDETKVTTLNAKFDEATGTLTFDTDRFSTYAIVYSDVVVSDGEGAPGTPDLGDGEVSTPETPKDETTPGTPETPKDDVSSDKTDDSVTNDKNDASSETGTNDKNDTSKDDVPKAGVISTTSIWLGAMAISGFGALLVSKKKKED